MSNAFTSALNNAQEAFNNNLVRRGQSRDSVETDDSPFGSSLATPVDADIVTGNGAPNSVLRFFGPNSSGEASMMDYFGLKKSGPPSSKTWEFGAGSSSSGPVDGVSNYSGSTGNPQISPGYSTPGSTRVESLTSKRSIYNFPNQPIEGRERRLASGDTCEYKKERGSHLDYSPSDSEAEFLPAPIPHSEFSHDDAFDCDFLDMDDILSFCRSQPWSPDFLATSVIKVICFVPWCICVGGTMLLWPDYLESVTFQVGYVDSLRGMPRFAFWAALGHTFVMIFLSFLLVGLWLLPLVAGAVLAFALWVHFCFVWKGIRIDYSVPIGCDDKQSLLLLAKLGERGLANEGTKIAKAEAGFVIIPSQAQSDP